MIRIIRELLSKDVRLLNSVSGIADNNPRRRQYHRAASTFLRGLGAR